MIITVSGNVGSGKSEVSKLLAIKLNYQYISIGSILREMAQKRNISLIEMSILAKNNPQIDKEIDKRQIELSKINDNMIFDGRLSFYFIPNSFKIFLEVSFKQAAKRIFDMKREHERYNSIQDAIKNIKLREELELERYKKNYKINIYDKKNYDLIINTENKTKLEVLSLILERLKN